MQIPKKVNERFEALKNEYKHLYLRNLSGRFYIYRVVQVELEGRKKVKTDYIGRITEDGAFVKRGMSKLEKKLEIARAVIEANGGMVTIPNIKTIEEEQTETEEQKMLSPSEQEQRILTVLSMDGRAKMKSIGNLLGITPQAAARKVKAVEKKYALDYIVEIDPVKLGYLEYMVFIKFEGPMPSAHEIKEVFVKQPTVQFCAMVKGDYDVMLYVLVDVNNAYQQVEDLQFSALTSFKAVWHIKSGYSHYGFVPIRDAFFELLKSRIWTRKKGIKEMPQYGLFQRDYNFLKQINSNGNVRFKEMDQTNKLPAGSSRYSYHKLHDSGVLKRVTINESNLPIAFDGVIFFKLTHVDVFQRTRNMYRLDLVADTKEPYNRYSLIFDVFDPGGFLAVAPITKGHGINDRVDVLKTKVEGAELTTMVITDVLVGNLSHRRFDNTYSEQYKILLSEKLVEQKENIKYDKL